ncbi:MAG: beta-lactamase family protein, partial [Planctomycetes bacterium]|nr:beta-lactamase family protein [Planctomycetota bacterium]
LQPFVDNHTVAGAVVLVASKDKVLGLGATGYADLAAKSPMRPDSLFWIASMSKPMTATALMMLVDEGKVNLDAPVEKYLPEFRGQMLVVEQDKDHVLLKHPAHPITVKEVLSHTSGLPFMSRVESRIDMRCLREAVLSYALTPLKSEPGTKYEYSNAGINTAGRIIEVVSGMPYEEFLDKRLLKPLGMKDTTFWPGDEQMARLAKSYKSNAGKTGLEELPIEQLTYPLTDRRRGPCPAGGLFSTAVDVSIFCRMILAGGVYEGKRYVSEAAVTQMTTTQTGDLLNQGKGEGGYGLGWSTSRKAPGKAGAVIPGGCGHGGAYATHLWIDPEKQRVTVLMVHRAGMPGPEGGAIQEAVNQAADALAK